MPWGVQVNPLQPPGYTNALVPEFFDYFNQLHSIDLPLFTALLYL